MTGIILYQSKYGATEVYARWLSEATGFALLETKRADIEAVSGYDVVILGGGIHASGIAGLYFLKKHIDALKGKRIFVFAVGASPYDKKAFDEIYAHNFKDQLSGIPLFYCRGRLDIEKMSFVDRNLCKMLQKSIAKEDPSTYKPLQSALMEAAGKRCDWTDRAYLQPLLDEMKSRA
jgi:menaquinone-dependent protoporphyrinogen IX oxidase